MGYGRTTGMGNAVNTEKVFINDHDISDYGAKALRGIVVGGTQITNDYFQGRNRTHYTLMSTQFGLKSISFTLVYDSVLLRTAGEHRSMLEAEMAKGCDLYLPDGFHYRCMLESIGEPEVKGVDGLQVLVSVAYKFSGIQHDPLETIDNGASFIAKGTMPQMDCRLTVTVGADADTYRLRGAVFSNVHAGDVIVFDGINKRFLKNGAPTTATEWITFPYVKPGQNIFTAVDPVKVEYYPCYI